MLEFATDLNAWIENHVELISLIGIPFLTYLVAKLSNSSAERRSAKDRDIERKLATELKVAEFRQVWINDLRNDLADFMSAAGDPKADGAATRGLAAMARIHLRLNPRDPDFNHFIDRMITLSSHSTSNKVGNEEWGLANADFIDISQRILKREWDRLKDDLRVARQ